MKYFPLHIGDWKVATSHLTPAEEAFYLRLVMKYMEMEGPLPVNQVHRWVGARSDEEKSAVDVVLEEFFTLEGAGFHHKRCEIEIAEARRRGMIAKRNGARGGRPKGNPEETQEEPRPNPEETQWVSEENPGKTQRVISGLAKPNQTETQRKPGSNPEETQKKANHKPITNNQYLSTSEKQEESKEEITISVPDVDKSPPGTMNAKTLSSKELEKALDLLQKAYPKRGGSSNWSQARKKVAQSLKSKKTQVARDQLAAMIWGARRYHRWAKATGKLGTELVAMATTWVNAERWRDECEIPDDLKPKKPISQAESPKRKLLAEDPFPNIGKSNRTVAEAKQVVSTILGHGPGKPMPRVDDHDLAEIERRRAARIAAERELEEHHRSKREQGVAAS